MSDIASGNVAPHAPDATRDRGARGLGGFLWDILACWIVGGATGIALGFAMRGVELLGLPAWAWCWPWVVAAGCAFFYLAARRQGQPDGILLVIKVSVVCVGLALLVSMGVGTAEGLSPPVPVSPHGPTTDMDLEGMRLAIGHCFAWLALVVAPSLAFVLAGLNLALLRREGAAPRG